MLAAATITEELVRMSEHDLARLHRRVVTRSISPENPTGAPGQGGRATAGTGAAAGRDLGPGWKISPSVHVEPPRSTWPPSPGRAAARTSG